MRYLLILVMLLTSCASPAHRKSDIVVVRDGKVVYAATSAAGKQWNTLKELEISLADDKKPDFVVFSAIWCQYCRELDNDLFLRNLREKIVFLNVDEFWVNSLAKMVNIRQIPALIITSDGGGPQSTLFYGKDRILSLILKNMEINK